jgi:hypothetical protein
MLCGFKGDGIPSMIYVNPSLVRTIVVDTPTTPKKTRITFDANHNVVVDVPINDVREALDKELEAF